MNCPNCQTDNPENARFCFNCGTALPVATLNTVGLTTAARAALGPQNGQPETAAILKSADIIVGPWTVATPFAGPQPDEEGIFAALAASPAHKVLIPKAEEDWDWAGVAGWKEETAVRRVKKRACDFEGCLTAVRAAENDPFAELPPSFLGQPLVHDHLVGIFALQPAPGLNLQPVYRALRREGEDSQARILH